MPQNYPYHILLGCRDLSAGEATLSLLRDTHSASQPTSAVELDVASDTSIKAAADLVQTNFGGLDVLVNNAGYAAKPKDDLSDVRQCWVEMCNVNSIGVALTIELFLPLFRSKRGSVINISSARGSITPAADGRLPPDAVAGYSVSRAALNRLMEFQSANPSHCKMAFNGCKGTRDLIEGASVVTELWEASGTGGVVGYVGAPERS